MGGLGAVARARQSAHQMGAYRLLLATSRPAIVSFFCGLQEARSGSFVISHVDPGNLARDWRRESFAAAAGVLDMAPDPRAAVQLCRLLHQARRSLPLAAL